ncbi:hypothetical protein P3342_009108 [Pyrenophora teres f. teres]|nr:hypothetical protein P3342_009108 [Pyrenophora teres f. teres]
MATAQTEQERQANRHRKEAKRYQVGDKVWLRLDKQYRTGRQSRKLDWKTGYLRDTTQSFTLTDYALPTQILYLARYKTTTSRYRYK